MESALFPPDVIGIGPDNTIPVFVFSDTLLPNMANFKDCGYQAVLVFSHRNHVGSRYVQITSLNGLISSLRTLTSAFPELTRVRTASIEVEDPVLKTIVVWGVTILLHPAHYNYIALCTSTERFHFSNIQTWILNKLSRGGK